MLSTVLILAALAGLSALTMSDAASASASQDPKAKEKEKEKEDEHPVVVIDTTAGAITVELDRAKAPISVENFLKYVDKGFYDGLIFHRVMNGFMIQGGGMEETNGTLQEKKAGAFPPIKNESSNGLKHARGTIAMARTPDPDSATSQFFINHVNNQGLDEAPGGYTVFGKVIDGMDVVDAIAKARVTTKRDSFGTRHQNVPATPISIKSVKRKEKA
jgi:cyclophilin family peptidyl-prolyl cis-trans isomerase